MKPADYFIRGRQLIAFLAPGCVWVFSGLMLIHIPKQPLALIVQNNPTWVAAAAFFGLSYVLGFSLEMASFRFADKVSKKLAAKYPNQFSDVAMEQRVASLKVRVKEVLNQEYGDKIGFVMPADELLFGYCKRILRDKSLALYQHLDIYEEEINLLSLTPLPLMFFMTTWIVCWSFNWAVNGFHWEEAIRYALPGVLTSAITATLCLARFQPFRIAELKETFESFLAYKIEKEKVKEDAKLTSAASDGGTRSTAHQRELQES